MSSRDLLRDALGWGVALWLFGYVLGVLLFFLVPTSLIGWVLSPVAILATLWVLTTRVRAQTQATYAAIAVVWTVIVIALDYVFIVRMLQPADGYYKLDVYLYYALTLALPIIVGWRRAPRG